MSIISEKLKKNEIHIPEVLVAARAMKTGMDVLRPLMLGEKLKFKGKAVLGTVKGDIHDIGKNLLKMLLEGKGIKVIDLGTR